MTDENKTRAELLEEVQTLRRQLAQRQSCSDPRLRLAALLDGLGDIYFTLDRDWRFTHLNAGACARAHRPAEELLGRTIWEAYPQLLGTALEAHYRHALATGESVHFEAPSIRPGNYYEVWAWPDSEGLTVYSRDITARRQAEQALRDSEQRHRVIASLTSDYTYTCRIEPDDRVILESASEGFTTVTGYTVEELQTRGGWPALVHPDDLPMMIQVSNDMHTGRSWEGELRLITRSGETRWIRSAAFPDFNPQTGRADRLLGAVQDITERKHAELALKAGEDLLRRILQAVPAGIVTVFPDGSMVQANEEACRILGLSWDELARCYVRDFEPLTFHDDGSPCPVEDYPVTKCLATGEQQPPRVIGVRRPDGQVFWSVYAALPLLDPESGKPRGAVVTFLDITARRRAEQALRESEERLRRFFEAAFEGIAFHQNGTILDANGPFAAMFGYDRPEDVIGRHVLDFAAPSSRDLLLANLRAGHEQPYEGLGLRRDGSTFPVELCGKNIPAAPCQLRIADCGMRNERPFCNPHSAFRNPQSAGTVRVTALRDITERKRAEARLQEYAGQLRHLSRRLMEVQEAERRHLARELHDEVGQVLTGLKLALKAAVDLPPQRQATGLGQAQRLLSELTGQVRALSQNLRPIVLDDLGLLPALLWLLDRCTEQTGVRVTFEHRGLEGRFRPEVETAAYRIVQEALTNVARHAEISEAAVRASCDERRLQIVVEDRGRGFDGEAVRSGPATGGLSGMRERAALLGGRLVIQSIPGAGTTLNAELPLDHPGESEPTDVDLVAG
ncbi:MAG: PAS domain S-box protein [Gemmataceae bacterium]|nr:PAS domain S-box protein [Gemmataceae bacterium]